MSDGLPEGWADLALHDHVYIAGRIGWRGLKASEYTPSGPVLLSVPNLNHGDEVSFEKVHHVSRARYDESPEIQLKPGDTLLVKDGAGIGKLGFVSVPVGPATVNSSLLVVRPSDDLLRNKFLFFYLKGPKFQEIALQRITGSATPHLFQKDIKTLRVLVPPLPEQQRIMAKLETLLGKVDACQRRLPKIPVLLKRFRQSVLAAACSGRLTADWREENQKVGAAADLIAAVSRGRRDRLAELRSAPAKKREVALKDFDNLEPALRSDLDLSDIPNTWSWVDLRFVMNPEEAFCYGVVQPGEDDPAGPRMIRVCDMESRRVLKDNLRGIPASVHAQYQRSMLRGGEVLVSVVGTIGRPAIATPDLAGMNIARAVAKIPVREFDARFVLLWLSTPRAETWMVGDSREVARKTLNLEQLRTLPIPLPPLAEQHEIVRRVDALFALADQIEARFQKAKAQIDRLTPALLAKAFRGELVPQDPNDEPASALLERIRAARESPAAPRRPARRTQSAAGAGGRLTTGL